jgi:4,5-DOPA dioxygenase extradiol
LREEEILILGSGNIVHNLGMMRFDGEAYPWTVEFDQLVKEAIEKNDSASLIHFQELGRAAELSINSGEHYLPLLYILGARQPEDQVTFYCETTSYGSLSMRCVQLG